MKANQKTTKTLIKLCLLILSLISPLVEAKLVPDKPTILITGSNRGLGLAFATQYAERGWNVIASCRTPSQAAELQALARQHPQLVVEKLDVTDSQQIIALKARYAEQPIDILLNNAGVYGDLEGQALGTLDYQLLNRVMAVNTVAPLQMAETFLDNVAASQQKKIISLGGGIGTHKIGRLFGGHYFFKMSKSAHLMSMGVLQKDVKKKGIIVAMISPGRVNTQMFKDAGLKGKSVSAADAASKVIAVIEQLDISKAGALLNFDGKVIQK